MNQTNLDALLGTLSYMLALLGGMFIACGRTPVRKHFRLRAVLGCTAVCIFRFFFSRTLWAMTFPSKNISVLAYSSQSILSCILCALCVAFCYRCTKWQVVYSAVMGFCLQFLTHKIYDLLAIFLSFSKPVETLIIVLTTTACYVAAWRHFFCRFDTGAMERRHGLQAPLVIVMFFFNLYVRLDLFGISSLFSKLMMWVVAVVAIGTLMLMELSLFSFNRVISERDMLLQLVEQQRKQYKSEQHSIEMINIKCHDMRHMLREKGSGVMDPDLIRELTEQMNIYDTHLKTGNEALDVILAKYGMECDRLGIRMSCMLDGEVLSFIPAYKMYAMFGNALENAVKAVRTLPEEKRSISISGTRSGELFSVRVANYFSGELKLENGLPVNHAENHGFGVKSIQMIAQEYGGDIHVQTAGELFILHILLPVPEEKA